MKNLIQGIRQLIKKFNPPPPPKKKKKKIIKRNAFGFPTEYEE